MHNPIVSLREYTVCALPKKIIFNCTIVENLNIVDVIRPTKVQKVNNRCTFVTRIAIVNFYTFHESARVILHELYKFNDYFLKIMWIWDKQIKLKVIK